MNGIFNFLCNDFLTIELSDGIEYQKGTVCTFSENNVRNLKIYKVVPDKDKGIVQRVVPYINKYTLYDVYTVNGQRYSSSLIKDITFDNKIIIETPKGKEKILSIFSISHLENTGVIVHERKPSISTYLEITQRTGASQIKCHLVGVRCCNRSGLELIVTDKTSGEGMIISPSNIEKIKKKRG